MAVLLPFAGLCSREVTVNIDPASQRAEINPYIYGQFIEHLGRCIYGGIWAEMLEDRKFYFDVADEYNPYRSLTDTDYPVVGASPWEKLGAKDGVSMTTDDVFVGDHSVVIREGSGIAQHDLGLIAGDGYVGYIWAKSATSAPASVCVKLSCGGKSVEQTLSVPAGDYVKLPLSFTAPAGGDDATLSICVTKGGIVLGTASLMPADNIQGMRADTIALLRELDSPIYRWPGGNFASGYDWRDGIGDRDRRPPRRNPAWTGIEHNDFGTDEFIAFCRLLGTDPMIAVNTGMGDAYSAAQWVEYCNRGADTIGGSWRVANGNAEPFAVRNWCVGNEMYGDWQLGHIPLGQYAYKHNLVAKAMHRVDRSIVLVASGDLDAANTRDDAERAGKFWSEGLLMNCSDNMDLISEHFYCGRLPWDESVRYPLAEAVTQIKLAIRSKAERHRALQASLPNLKGRIIPISMDEWNYWHREYIFGELGCPYDMADALGIAEGLHEYSRQSDIIQMASYAQTVNVIGAIKTSRTQAQMETTGLVLSMYRKHFGNLPVATAWECDALDITAALTEDGCYLTIGVVNPTAEAVTLRPALASGRLSGAATRWTVANADEFARNLPGEARAIDIVETPGLDTAKGLVVPPMSANVIRVKIER